ncbi:hypothetical protein II906_03250 [bacterium]|nr:hypothetical protein [bacterium]
MKVDIQKNSLDNNEKINITPTPEEKDILNPVNVPFSELVQQNNNSEVSSETINYLSSLPVDYNYDSLLVGYDDAMFFVNLAQDGKFSIENSPQGDFKNLIMTEVSQTAVTQRTVEVTNHITQLIEKASNTQKPVRITFDNDVSVVLKIDKHGKVTAEFIPGSIEVENYLKNNIASLKQRFDEQNLPYNDLYYRQNNKENRQNKDKNKGDK